uniref:Uncharacterized protein n=1 Tax=Acrobeloides nanus TaxID=290746 RepID=A0A914EHE3_9BILA
MFFGIDVRTNNTREKTYLEKI